nr:pyridoxine 5'-phosphate oxidase C-terminal domain-containing protein [Angustibacter aerolatus]
MSSPLVDPDARLQYAGDLLGEVEGAPWPLLERWYAEAVADDRVVEPGAMVVATVDAEGVPDARTVLLKQARPERVRLLQQQRVGEGRAGSRGSRTPPSCCCGTRCSGRCGPAAGSSAPRRTRPRPTSRTGRAGRRSPPAPPASRSRWPTEPTSSAPSPRRRPAGPTPARPPTSHRRRPGPATAWCPRSSSLWVGRQSRLHDRVAFRRTGDGDLADPASWRAERLQP